MGVRLTVKMKSGKDAGKPRTVVLDDEVITFGRDQTCQVVLAQQAVSRSHARISKDGTLFFLEDLGSSFGTQVNGQKLPKGEKRLLRNGDTIAIAQFDVVFDRVADINVSDRSEKTSFLSRNLMRDAMKGLDTETAYFRVMNGPTEGTRIEIADAQEYVFGRDGGDADIVLNDDLVSRRHAKVRRDWSGTHVEDLGSRNGIKVNRKRTKKEQLRDRDELEIGGVKLLFIDPSEPREDAVVLSDPGEEEAEGEHTESGGQALEEPETEERSPPEEAPPEPPPEEEPPPPEPEESPEESSVEAPPPDDEPSYEAPAYTAPGEPEEAPAGNNPLRNIDFKNPQHLVVLIMGGVFVILGVVLIIALLAGA